MCPRAGDLLLHRRAYGRGGDTCPPRQGASRGAEDDAAGTRWCKRNHGSGAVARACGRPQARAYRAYEQLTSPTARGWVQMFGTSICFHIQRFGKGSIMRMGDEERQSVACIPTGALALDLALGVGGLPRGRVVEIFGPESSGKTTLALHVIAEAQKAGGLAAFVDAEHAIDPSYAQAIGIDLENLSFSQPDNGEQALEIADTLVRSGALDVVVIDSVAALVPRAEIEGENGRLSRGASGPPDEP